MLKGVFDQLILFMGGWGTTVLATIFFMIIVRIGIAFVFKLFRLNVNYRSLVKKK